MPFRLESADDTPAQRGQHQPPVKRHPVDGSRAGLLIGPQEALDAAEAAGAQAGRGAESPGPDAEPRQVFVRLADVHKFPIQHGGKVGSVDDEVAHPEVAVHQHRRRRVGPVCGQPAKPPFEGGGGVAHVVEAPAPFVELVLVCQARAVWVGAVNGGRRLRALPQQSGAAGVPVTGVEPALDAPHDGLALDLIADKKRITQCRRRIVGDQDVGDRSAGGRGGGLGPGLEFHAGMHVVGWTGAQDQRAALRAGHRLERPGGSAGAAGQRAQVLDRRVGADGRREHGGEFGRQLCRLVVVHHFRPKLNSRCATRRIWISSAPSVIR